MYDGETSEVDDPTVFDIIRASKSNVKIAQEWKSGKIPHTAFPLTKGRRTLPVGNEWSWRLVEFDALGLHCRVLLRLNEQKARYQAVLGVETDGGFRVICHHELHIGEKGWHCHFCSCSVHDVFPGVMRDFVNMRSWETEPGSAETVTFTVTSASALTKAATRFRFKAQGELM